jgi:hypothetical protein
MQFICKMKSRLKLMEFSFRILMLVKLSYLCQGVKHVRVLYHFCKPQSYHFLGAPWLDLLIGSFNRLKRGDRAEIEACFGICQCINTRITRIIMLELSLYISSFLALLSFLPGLG